MTYDFILRHRYWSQENKTSEFPLFINEQNTCSFFSQRLVRSDKEVISTSQPLSNADPGFRWSLRYEEFQGCRVKPSLFIRVELKAKESGSPA